MKLKEHKNPIKLYRVSQLTVQLCDLYQSFSTSFNSKCLKCEIQTIPRYFPLCRSQTCFRCSKSHFLTIPPARSHAGSPSPVSQDNPGSGAAHVGSRPVSAHTCPRPRHLFSRFFHAQCSVLRDDLLNVKLQSISRFYKCSSSIWFLHSQLRLVRC